MSPSNVHSVAQIHAPLLDDHNLLKFEVFQGPHSSSKKGAPINPYAVLEAENTVESLSAAKCNEQLDVNTFAQHKLEKTFEHLNQMEKKIKHLLIEREARSKARCANTCITSRNRRHPRDPLHPLQKIVRFFSHHLAEI